MKKSPVVWVGRSEGINNDWVELYEEKPDRFSNSYGSTPFGFAKFCYKEAHLTTGLTLNLGEIKPFRIKFVPVRGKK